MKRLPYLADFDSASAMLRALARCLRGEGFPDLGMPSVLRPLAIATNSLPGPARREVYKLGGLFEAISPRRLGHIRDEEIARWVVDLFPEPRYPAVLVGASNGALIHLWRRPSARPGCPRPSSSRCASTAATWTSRPKRLRSGARMGPACSTPVPTFSCTRCTTPIRTG